MLVLLCIQPSYLRVWFAVSCQFPFHERCHILSMVEAGSNPYSKYTIKIIFLYSIVGVQKYEIEWQNCSRLLSKQGYLLHE